MALADFNYSIALVKKSGYLLQLPFECGKQCFFPAVADSYPENSPRVDWAIGKVKKIFVLAHNDPVSLGGIIPNLEVRCLVHSESEDMTGPMSLRCQKFAKRFRELIVHQEIHALISTTWSVSREA